MKIINWLLHTKSGAIMLSLIIIAGAVMALDVIYWIITGETLLK